jgi:DNA modification methylase
MVKRTDLYNVNRIAGGVGTRAPSGSASRTDLQIAYLPPERLRPSPTNARTHSKKQLKQIASSIERFGFVNPVLISDGFEIIAGHGRVEAAKNLGLREVPTVRLSNLSPAERRAYVIADNRLAELAGWDRELLATELQGLVELQFDDIELTGFSLGEIDLMLDEAAEKKAERPGPEDELPANSPQGPAVSRAGDLWVLGPHRLLCGDARDLTSYQFLLEGKQADLVLTDPLPFNIAIEGNVSGLGRVGQPNFAMASGEMSEDQFIAFLTVFLQRAKENTKDGAILFVFMDWRHLYELITASREVGLALKNLGVWAKDDAAMGSFYRLRHELVLVFKNGDAPHTDTLELGRHGHRTNIWEYTGVTGFRAGRTEDLALRPTVKLTALVADAIRDVSRRGAIVLDPFAGNGTTIIAAEKTGRHGRAIELDPLYCDVIVRRWQQYTGKAARLEGSDLTFEDVEATRLAGQSASTA